MVSNIDPAYLMAQWQAMQSANLPTSATIPTIPIAPNLTQEQLLAQAYPQYFRAQPQQLPQEQLPQGEFLDRQQLNAIVDFVKASNIAAEAARLWVDKLESEYERLLNFSVAQDELISRFLFDREFTLNYIRGAWIQDPIDNDFACNVADVYLELDKLFPRHQKPQSNPQSNPQFDARLMPNGTIAPLNAPLNLPASIPAQNLIPPLPNSNNNGQGFTAEDYAIAMQNGYIAQAKAAALKDAKVLYGQIFG